jgi:hypothetical protein
MSWIRRYFPQFVLVSTVLFMSAFALGVVVAQRGVDFAVYYLTAQALRQGTDIYTLTGADFTQLAATYHVANFTAPYLYPPLTAGVVVGLAGLPYAAAYSIWNLLSVAAVIGSGLALSRFISKRWIDPVVFLILLLWFPIYTTLYAGQINNFILLGIVLYLAWSARRTFYPSGLALALSLLIKPLAAPLILHLAWRRDWRRVWAVSVGLLVAVFITFLVAGLPSLMEYARLGSSTLDIGNPLAAYPPRQSVFGFFGRAFTVQPYSFPLIDHPGLGLILALIISAALIGGAAFLTWPRRHLLRDTFALETGLVLVTANLVLPVMWYHHLAVVVVAVILAWHGASRGLRIWLAVAMIFIAVQGLAWHHFVGHLLLLSWGTYGLLLIYAVSAYRLWPSRQN